MKNLEKALLLLITLFLIIIVLPLNSGCSNQEGTPTPTIPKKGTLTLYSSAPLTLDPALARSMDSMQYIVEIFSGLVTFDQKLNLVPDVAERWEKIAGGTVYIFFLRQDAKFHDGRAVTANDFKYSWERACDPETQSQIAETYLGDIVGVKDKLAGNTKEIAGIKVINDYVLQVTIDSPKEYFLSKLAYPTAFVVDKYNVESGVKWWQNPNGTGPFKLRTLNSDKLILERNDEYYLDSANIERAVFLLSGGIPMMMYENGQIDVTGISLDDIERVNDPNNLLNKELIISPAFSLTYIGFNSSKPPFDDAKIRQAFCHAIDKEKLVSLTLKSTVLKADGIIPPEMPGYNEYVKGLNFDVSKAFQLIGESKYGSVSNLPPITLTSAGEGMVSNVEAALIDMWRENLGIEVAVNLWQPDIYPYILMEEKDEMFSMGWIADYPDPQDFLDILFRSGEKNNFGEYTNTKLDYLLDKAAVETDRTARILTYYLAEQEIIDSGACLPLFFDVSYMLIKPYVKNFPTSPLGISNLKYVYIEEHQN